MRTPPIFRLPAYVVFWWGDVGIVLHPRQENLVMLNLTVGHTATGVVAFLDQNGNPMLTPLVPDSPPTWTNNPVPAGADTLTPATNGLGATLVANAAGTDTINFSVVVGGVTFSASTAVSISAAPQVLTSVQLDWTVN
jgi:hypothetical protein